jgi:hypothetical protein
MVKSKKELEKVVSQWKRVLHHTNHVTCQLFQYIEPMMQCSNRKEWYGSVFKPITDRVIIIWGLLLHFNSTIKGNEKCCIYIIRAVQGRDVFFANVSALLWSPLCLLFIGNQRLLSSEYSYQSNSKIKNAQTLQTMEFVFCMLHYWSYCRSSFGCRLTSFYSEHKGTKIFYNFYILSCNFYDIISRKLKPCNTTHLSLNAGLGTCSHCELSDIRTVPPPK